MPSQTKLRCDSIGCDETHPIDHDCLGQPGFDVGYWLGWLYLDLNRPDLAIRPLRFCGARCLEQWVMMHTNRPHLTKLDEALRDEVAAKAHRSRIKAQLSVAPDGPYV